MLLTENCSNTFEFVKVIIQNTVNPDTVKMAFFDDVTITSALRSDMLIHRQFSNILVKWSLRMIHAKSYENIFKFVKVMHIIL